MIRGALTDNAEVPECQMPIANSSFPIKQLPPLIQTFAIHVNKLLTRFWHGRKLEKWSNACPLRTVVHFNLANLANRDIKVNEKYIRLLHQ
jgi:hypothetical protein